jgi:hypothetical protein
VNITDEASQRKLIEDSRLLLKPCEVKLHSTPPWLNKRLRDYRRSRKLDTVPISMLLTWTIQDIGHQERWLDHWGTSVRGPFACCNNTAKLNFVSEPYGFSRNTAKELDLFCDVLGGLDWHVSSNTFWYPGATVRITIHEPNGMP